MWGISLLNSEHKCGTDVHVLNVSKDEMHLFESCHPHRIAHIFKRIGLPEAINAPDVPVSTGRGPREAVGVAGEATPAMRRLEKAISRRNPLLADRLKPGLPESDIQEALNRANVTGAIEPVIELYSWRNGTSLDESTPMEEASFFPEDVYQFIDLQMAIERWKSMNQAGAQLREMVQGTEASGMFDGMTSQLFPLFSDGGTGVIAVDLAPSKQNRVVAVEFESDEPVRQAYRSFEDFITDAIRANREGRNLSCFD